MDEGDPGKHGFPRPDSHPHKGDAALEFIKHVCAVLALDQNVQHDVLVSQLQYDKTNYLSSMVASTFAQTLLNG